MATLWPRLAEWVKTAGLFAVHFNRIGCRLHNLHAYFTCAQPPIRPYSAQLLSRFSPSPFPPSTHQLPFPPCTQPPSGRMHPPLPRWKPGFAVSTRNVYEQMPLPDLFQLDLSTKEAFDSLVVARSFSRYPPFVR